MDVVQLELRTGDVRMEFEQMLVQERQNILLALRACVVCSTRIKLPARLVSTPMAATRNVDFVNFCFCAHSDECPGPLRTIKASLVSLVNSVEELLHFDMK